MIAFVGKIVGVDMKKFPTKVEWKLMQALQDYIEQDNVEPNLCIAAMNWIDTFETRSHKEIPVMEAILNHAEKLNW